MSELDPELRTSIAQLAHWHRQSSSDGNIAVLGRNAAIRALCENLIGEEFWAWERWVTPLHIAHNRALYGGEPGDPRRHFSASS